jgi:hypothetical protein
VNVDTTGLTLLAVFGIGIIVGIALYLAGMRRP